MSDNELEIELPPEIEDSFEIPDTSILISPSIVDNKIKQYLQLINATPSTTPNIKVSLKDDVQEISAEQLRDIVYTQILHNTNSSEMSIDETVAKGMKIAQHLYKQTLRTRDARTRDASSVDCGFEDILHEMLKRSWVPDSTAKSLTGYVTKFLTESKETVSWSTIKEIFDYSIDDRTLILIYLVTYSYVLAVCSPLSQQTPTPATTILETYPGYYLNDLQKYITAGVILSTKLLESHIDWPAVIIHNSGKSTLNGSTLNASALNALALSEWFVLAVLGLQTGYVGFRLGEKVWNLVHTVVNKCQIKTQNKKQIRKIIEQQSKLLLD